MAVGTYDVSAEQAGFQKMVQTGIVMNVGARRVLDFKLAVGQPVEVVEVQGQASTVNTETASVGALIAPTQMENLPLNGRNFTDLLSLAAGVATVPASRGGRRPVGHCLRSINQLLRFRFAPGGNGLHAG